jgi:hypothetical protein
MRSASTHSPLLTQRSRRPQSNARRICPHSFTGITAYLAEIDVDALWNAATEAERRVLVDELIEFVDVHDDHLQVIVRGAPKLNFVLAAVGLGRQGEFSVVSEGRGLRSSLAATTMVEGGPKGFARPSQSGNSLRMKLPPKCLPPATSSKWHGRRVWDSLGYVRACTIANPNWERDADWVIRMLESQLSGDPGEARDLIDEAVATAKTYRAMRKRGSETDDEFAERRDQQWDEILVPMDTYLELVQTQHLRAVRRAGKSGPQVPEV